MRKLPLLLFFVLFLFPVVYSADLKLSMNQSDYYFLVGEEAIISLDVENTYGMQIEGMLTYRSTTKVNQGGFSYSESNSQSQSFGFKEGESSVSINFGGSNQPMEVTVGLSFKYNDGTETLDDIMIHYVNDASQQQNQENKQESQSSSENSENGEQESGEDQQSLSEKVQEQLKSMFNQQSAQSQQSSSAQSHQQQSQQRVQNNQMAQDSNALKQQMQKQMQEQQQIEEEFQKNLASNPEFQKAHEEMLQKGYTPSSFDTEAQNETSGDFEVNYEKEEERASIKGEMEDNSIKSLEKESTEDVKRLIDMLSSDPRFQKFDSGLVEDGFVQGQIESFKSENVTYLNVPYANSQNETATIIAEIDSEIRKVSLDRKNNLGWIYVVVFLLFLVFGWYVYFRNGKKAVSDLNEGVVDEKIDYRLEASKILDKSVEMFNSDKKKDAYGKAGEAIRFFYKYDLGVGKEVTNSELINLLRHKKKSYSDTQKCLNLCSLVEFAKYSANKKDFDKIIELGRMIVKKS